MDSLASLPRDTASFRQLLFDLPVPFRTTLANWKLIWPLIDNIYSIRQRRQVTADHVMLTKQCLICRFRQAAHDLKRPSSSARAYKRQEINWRA
jgi:hypothetical protein